MATDSGVTASTGICMDKSMIAIAVATIPGSVGCIIDTGVGCTYANHGSVCTTAGQ